jgi:hypothetical protein
MRKFSLFQTKWNFCCFVERKGFIDGQGKGGHFQVSKIKKKILVLARKRLERKGGEKRRGKGERERREEERKKKEERRKEEEIEERSSLKILSSPF